MLLSSTFTQDDKKIKAAMEKQYGKKQGQTVFYASANKGTIKGVKKKTRKTKK